MAGTLNRKQSLKLNCDDEIISDETLETMLDALDGTGDDQNVAELLQAMNENRIISREEAEQILEVGGPNTIVKCGLPPHVRPSDPENTTDPEECVSRLLKNDPALVEINLNNMKRTPIPVIQRMLMSLSTNTHLKKLSLANVALTDTGAEPILEALESNTTLEMLNIETNYLSGDFLARLFKSALTNQTLREIKAVNQSPTFSTESEMEIMQAVHRNRGLTKVSVNLRHPEAKNKVENACLRNGEIRRQQRRLEQLQKQQEATAGAKTPTDGVVENNKIEAKAAAKPATAKADEKKPEAAPAKKRWERPAPPAKKEVSNAVEAKPAEKKTTEKAVEPVADKKPVEPEKKPSVKRAYGKKTAAEGNAPAAPPPPPAPKVEPTPKETPAHTPAPEKAAAPKPTLAMAAKEAAAKAAAKGFGTSAAPDATPKKRTSISERSKPVEEVKPIETPMPLPTKTSASRPGSLSISAKEIPTSKGLGAATLGSTTPKPASPSKAEAAKASRRGSGTVKPLQTPTTPTPKLDSPAKSRGSPIKLPGTSSRVSDLRSKIDSAASDPKSKPLVYGYGSSIKKRDSVK